MMARGKMRNESFCSFHFKFQAEEFPIEQVNCATMISDQLNDSFRKSEEINLSFRFLEHLIRSHIQISNYLIEVHPKPN